MLQSYELNWYHKYLFHTGLDITEAIIYQYLYCTTFRKSVYKVVSCCDTCQNKKVK